jgi:hypothetical protein
VFSKLHENKERFLKLNVRAFFLRPKYFRIFSLFFLVVVLLLEGYGVNQLTGTLPPTIGTDNARLILQSLIAFDGVLLGFGAIVFATLIGRESTFERLSYILLSMITTVFLFLLSVANAFFGLVSISSAGLSTELFIQPFGLMIFGASVFFFTIYVHIVRVYLVGQARA